MRSFKSYHLLEKRTRVRNQEDWPLQCCSRVLFGAARLFRASSWKRKSAYRFLQSETRQFLHRSLYGIENSVACTWSGGADDKLRKRFWVPHTRVLRGRA